MFFNEYLSKYDGKDVCIVVLDTGLDSNSLLAHELHFKGGIGFFENEKGEVLETKDVVDDIGHGTAVATLIHKMVPNASIIPIKVLGEKWFNSTKVLIDALRFVDENIKCDIINISIGITCSDELNELYEICKKLSEKGIIIISAFDNSEVQSYPAAFDCVIGIEGNHRIHNLCDVIRIRNSPVDFQCRNLQQRVQWINREVKVVCGNSFLAPYFTAYAAKVCQYMNEQSLVYNNKIFLDIVEKQCNHVIEKRTESIPSIPFEIKRAITFPFNKEIHSLARFKDMLQFNIDNFCDTKYSGVIGKNLKQLQGIDVPETIKNIDKIDWEENFDTVILGHTGELSGLTKIDWCRYIIERCMKYNKKLYSFSNIYNLALQMGMDKKNIFCPHVPKPETNDNKLKMLNIPVVGIVGTSSKQGKYTIQLFLRREFIKRGYNIGQLGTEPSALLFGMDAVYPMGYDRSVDVCGYEAVTIVNQYLAQIEANKKDIILFGGQSHCLLHRVTDEFKYYILNNELLYGAQADAYFVCVNYDDSIDYITRLISYLESMSEAKVLALILSPLSVYSPWTSTIEYKENGRVEIEERVNYLKSKIGIPVVSLNAVNVASSLVDLCEAYFG